MAEDQIPVDVTPAPEQPKPKRRIRAAQNGETVRERSEKMQKRQLKADSSEPGNIRLFFRGFLWPLAALGRQIGKLNRFKLFRIIGYIFVPPYIRGSWRELRQVTWPSRRQAWSLTYAVIIFSIVFGVLVFAVDLGLDKLFKEIIIKR